MEIKIIWDENSDKYSVLYNGTEIINDLSQDQIERLTIREIIDLQEG